MEPTPPTPESAPTPTPAKPSVPGTVVAAQVLMWLHFTVIPCFPSARMPGAFTQPLLTIGFEGSIAICLCTPSAKAWFTDPRSESDALLFAVQPEERE
jgi:hypothetical protein